MLILEQLEDTTLYDAGLAVDIAESLNSENDFDSEPNISELLDNSNSESAKELVIIDSRVADQQVFISDISDIEYIIIKENENLGLLTTKIASFSKLNSIHIISHGSEGQIELAGQTINSQTAMENLNFFNAVKNSLSQSGDLLLYGCNVADQSGLDFIQLVSQLSDADVAASEDLTGSANLGGDWELEVNSGEIDTESLFIEDYDHLLATQTVPSLRFQATIADAIFIEYNIETGASRLLNQTEALSRGSLYAAQEGFVNNSQTFEVFSPNPISDLRNGSTPTVSITTIINGSDAPVRVFESPTQANGYNLYFEGIDRSAGTLAQLDIIFNVTYDANEPPNGQDQTVSAIEDTSYTFSTLDFSNGYNDADGDPFTNININNLPSGSLELNGSPVLAGDIILAADIPDLKYQGLQDVFGTNADSFQFTVGDGNAFSTSYTMTINLTAVNDAPVILTGSAADTGLAGTSETLAEDNNLTLNLSDYIFDADSDPLSLDGLASAQNGTILDNGDGTITYTPDTNFFGSDSLSLTVTDGEFNVEIDIPIIITPVNDAPLSQAQDIRASEDTDYIFDISDFTAGYSDVENDPFSGIRIDSLPVGSLSLNGSDVSIGDELSSAVISNLIYRAEQDQFGDGLSSFQFSVFDGTDYSISTNTMTIDVNPVNDAPILRTGSPAETGIAGASDVIAEDNALTLNLSDYVLDIENDLLSLDALGSAINGNVIDNGDGTITYTPKSNFFGADSLNLTVTDGEFNVDISVPIEVTPVNDAPLIQADSVFTDFNTSILIDPLSNDSDIENDPLFISRIISVANGVATINGDHIEFTPLNNFNGTAIIVYEISDGQDVSSSTISVEVEQALDFIDFTTQEKSPFSNKNQLSIESDALKEDPGEIFNLAEGEYSVNSIAESFHSNFLSQLNTQISDGEYSVLSPNEPAFHLHDTVSEPLSSQQLKSEIQNLISDL
ncbi:MAG: tandem-95 repeat protein [Lentisphaeraceae bacterium]|nr:tandem-95 repeat protein [Lentisphaeraceae bacterium]